MVRILLVIVLLSFALTGCEKDDPQPETGTLDLVFKLQYQGDPLVMFQRYPYDNDMSIFFTRFSFYLSNLEVKNSGETILLQEIDYLNLTDSHMNTSSAINGMTYNLEDVAPGSYSSISFSIGVPEDLNALTPVDFEPGHPLFDSGEYWSGWSSYIFHKTEGKLDTDGDDIFDLDLALHVGSNEVFRTIELPASIDVVAGTTTNLEIVIDLHELFFAQNNEYDILTTPQIHSLSQIDQAIILADNLTAAIR